MADIAGQNSAIALFVRHPFPGRVKTRLASALGAAAACDLYLAMVADIIANISACDLPIYLFHYGQDDSALPPEWLNAAKEAVCQVGDSLGERMTAAFEFLFSIGWERVILIGSDIPGIDEALLQSAIVSLQESDVVFAPALDGGYCLVASRKGHFNGTMFKDIPWSTSRVLEVTLNACRVGDVSYTLLEPRRDIDTLSDMEAYCRQPSPTAPATNAWLVSYGYLPSHSY